MRLSIIRHGMTEANEKRLYCGSTDIPLSEQGRHSLAMLKETVIYPAADVYITSGLIRACETLRILYNREPDAVMAEFKEMAFGDFEMKSYEELKDKPAYRLWISGGCETACPNGESRDAFDSRVMAGLDKLFDVNSGTGSYVVVCHGGVIVSIMERLFPGKKNFYEWQPDFGRGYTLDISPEREAQWRLL